MDDGTVSGFVAIERQGEGVDFSSVYVSVDVTRLKSDRILVR